MHPPSRSFFPLGTLPIGTYSVKILLTQHRNLLLSLGPLLGRKLLLGLPVVLGGVDAVLVVVDKVEPGDGIEEGGGVPRLPRRDALHVWAQRAHAVQWLAALDLVDHLPHVHLDLPCVLAHAVEPHCKARTVSNRPFRPHSPSQVAFTLFLRCVSFFFPAEASRTDRSLVERQETAADSDETGESHHPCEGSASGVRGCEPLHRPEQTGTCCGCHRAEGVVRWSGIADYPLEMSVSIIQSELVSVRFVRRGCIVRVIVYKLGSALAIDGSPDVNWCAELTGYSVLMVLLGMYVCGVWFAMVATGNLAASEVEDCDQLPGRSIVN